jgi:hypothetical protein
MSFGSRYHLDTNVPLQKGTASFASRLETVAPGIVDFLSQFSGASFNRGLYRIISSSEIPRWTTDVAAAFPSFKGRILCFSYDWLGRHFAIDFARKDRGKCQILMLEPGSGEALEIPATFQDFHDIELVQHPNEALAVDAHSAWLDAGGAIPRPSECVGYKKPLFLGGKDAIDNFELIDMDVYWSICAQLLQQVRELPEGTKIGDIRII